MASSHNARLSGRYALHQKQSYAKMNTHFFNQLCLIFVLTTVYLFYPCNQLNAASAKTSRYEINGQLSVYLPHKLNTRLSNTRQSNTRASNIGPYANIMLIKKTLIEKKITKITLAESGFKPIPAQAIPFKLSYADISRHSKNTIDSTSHYEIYVVIAGNRDGKPVITTMTTAILAKQNYNDLNLVLQALAEPVE